MNGMISMRYEDLRGVASADFRRAPTSQQRGMLSPGTEFEAVLLAKLLDDLQESFSVSEAAGEDDGVSGQFRGFATEALGREFARSGGIGLASMIDRELPRSGP